MSGHLLGDPPSTGILHCAHRLEFWTKQGVKSLECTASQETEGILQTGVCRETDRNERTEKGGVRKGSDTTDPSSQGD